MTAFVLFACAVDRILHHRRCLLSLSSLHRKRCRDSLSVFLISDPGRRTCKALYWGNGGDGRGEGAGACGWFLLRTGSRNSRILRVVFASFYRFHFRVPLNRIRKLGRTEI